MIRKNKHKSWLSEYLENCKNSNKSDHTIKNYKADLTKFLIWHEVNFPRLYIHKTRPLIIENYKNFLTTGGVVRGPQSMIQLMMSILRSFFRVRAQNNKIIFEQLPLAVSSQRRHLSSVKNFFEFLKQKYEDKERIFTKNPFKSKLHSVKLKEVDVKNTKILNHIDFEKLNESLYYSRDRLIIYLLYYAGMRLSEIINLKKENFNAHKQTITFVRKGGYKHELIPQMADTIFYEYKKHLQINNNNSDYLFCDKKLNALSPKTLYNMIMRLLKKVGVPSNITPHSFRKSCATNLYIKTKDLLLVRDYLNHNDAKVTQTYIDKKTLNKDYYRYI